MSSSTRRRGRRLLGAAAAVGLSASLAVVGASSPAAATEDDIEHFCGSYGLPDDNGPVTDLVHHAVEDLLLRPTGRQLLVHPLNCRLTQLETMLRLR